MLTQLYISNFTIAKSLCIEYQSGFSVLTGETGAGKSITIDALNLLMGQRADSQVIRQHCERAEISACFDIQDNAIVTSLLTERGLESDDKTCILRRIISNKSNSRAFINGRPCTLAEMQDISRHLINIHGQHAQQELLDLQQQRKLLDRYAQAQTLSEEVEKLAKQWQALKRDIRELEQKIQHIEKEREFLNFQLREFTECDIKEGEIEQLEDEQRQLSQADDLITAIQHSIAAYENELEAPNIRQLLNDIKQQLSPFKNNSTISECLHLITESDIQIQEAVRNLESYHDRYQANPERLLDVEQRLDQLYTLARKHRIQPMQLIDRQHILQAELAQLSDMDKSIETLQAQLATVAEHYHNKASQLSQKRAKAATALALDITGKLQQLNMAQAQFSVQLLDIADQHPHPAGLETVEFMVSTNPGSPSASLKRVASGGELSRLSLAIEVALQDTVSIPTLIFDEVDAGIGGTTATIVGQLMQSLGANKQVICVTHQAQLASKAHHHYLVQKTQSDEETQSSVLLLNQERRIEEVARMISGMSITQTTLEHAKELLSIV